MLNYKIYNFMGVIISVLEIYSISLNADLTVQVYFWTTLIESMHRVLAQFTLLVCFSYVIWTYGRSVLVAITCKTTRPSHLVKLFTNSSGAMTVTSANVEGLSDNTASILSEMCKMQHCHCLCLQETHRAKDHIRPNIPGMPLVAERPHNKHGSSVFVIDGLTLNSISIFEEENVEFITVERPGVVVHSLYRPPPEPFQLPPLGQRIKPHIVIGDFNSHSTLWGYTTTDSNGEAVEQWADSNRLSLIHNAKLPKLLNSAIWNKGYNPDLIFVSSNISDMCEKSVLDPIPRTQHRPICVTVHPVILPQPTPFRRRFNLRKAKWDDFSTDLDEAMEEVEHIL